MDELKKIVDMVADKNYIWVLITTLGKEPLIHTAHNGKWRVSELQGDLKTIVDFMIGSMETYTFDHLGETRWKEFTHSVPGGVRDVKSVRLSTTNNDDIVLSLVLS